MGDVLEPAARATLHERSLDVLAEVGMRVEHAGARRALADAGATVEDSRVTLPRDLIERTLEDAPASFTWHARTPDNDVTVGGDAPPVVTPGTGARHVYRPGEGRRAATMEDFETLVRLAHAEDAMAAVGYDLCSPEPYALAGNPGGIDAAATGYELLETLLTASDKPLVGSARSRANARASIAMAGIARGDPDFTEPAVLGRVHPLSPRLWNEPIVDGLFEYASADQPLVISSGAIAGASGPTSLPETLVLANAETVFGVVLAQVVSPGTPVVFGYASAGYDRRAEAVAYAGPTATLLSAAGAEMAAHYDLPSRVDGAVADAKTLGDQCGAESALKLEAAFDADADVVFNAAGLFDTYETVSPEKFVLDCERIRRCQFERRSSATMSDRLAGEDVSLDAIRDAEPGAAFADERTDQADGPFRTDLAVRGRYEDWASAGEETAVDRATDRVDALLESYVRPHMDDAVRSDLREYVAEHSDR